MMIICLATISPINEQSILNVSRRLSTIEIPTSTSDVPTTSVLGEVTLATMEHLPLTDDSLVLDSASESNANEPLTNVSYLNMSVSTSVTPQTTTTSKPSSPPPTTTAATSVDEMVAVGNMDP